MKAFVSMAFLAVAVCIASAEVSPVRAGCGGILVTVVNMTPEAASTEASRSCIATIRRVFRQTEACIGKAEVRSVGETAYRKRIGKTDAEPFMAWPQSAFGGDGSGVGWTSTVLVSCQPEMRYLDFAVVPPSGVVVHLRSRRVNLDDKHVKRLSSFVSKLFHMGYSP